MAVAQGQHAKFQARQRRARCCVQQAREAARAVRRLAFAKGAGDDQGPFVLAQLRGVKPVQRLHVDGDPGLLQGARAFQGQALGLARLAGVGDEGGQAGILLVRCAGAQHGALRLHCPFCLAAAQVQHPARDGEQGQAQAGQGNDDAARQAEIRAHVQRINDVDEARTEALLAVRLVFRDRAVGRQDAHAAARPFVRRVVGQPRELHGFAGARGQAHAGQGPAGGVLLEAGPGQADVDGGRFLLAAAFFRGRLCHPWRLAGPGIDIVAHHVIAPVNACQGQGHVDDQAPGAGHGVQIPQKRAALQGGIEGQPRAPVQRPAGPAQIQAGQG
ncbi:hypothetical protein D3C85_736210 [compost metagenome]